MERTECSFSDDDSSGRETGKGRGHQASLKEASVVSSRDDRESAPQEGKGGAATAGERSRQPG